MNLFLNETDGTVEIVTGETGEIVYDAVLYGAEEEAGEPLIAPAPEETVPANDIAPAPEQETEAILIVPAKTEAKPMPIGDAGIAAALGYGVVFAGLFILLAVVAIMGAIFKASAKKKAAKAAATAEELPADVPAVEAKTAPGTAGEVKLFDVPDKEAAMIMAIVADKLQKPLNELRFISIKEVK